MGYRKSQTFKTLTHWQSGQNTGPAFDYVDLSAIGSINYAEDASGGLFLVTPFMRMPGTIIDLHQTYWGYIEEVGSYQIDFSSLIPIELFHYTAGNGTVYCGIYEQWSGPLDIGIIDYGGTANRYGLIAGSGFSGGFYVVTNQNELWSDVVIPYIKNVVIVYGYEESDVLPAWLKTGSVERDSADIVECYMNERNASGTYENMHGYDIANYGTLYSAKGQEVLSIAGICTAWRNRSVLKSPKVKMPHGASVGFQAGTFSTLRPPGGIIGGANIMGAGFVADGPAPVGSKQAWYGTMCENIQSYTEDSETYRVSELGTILMGANLGNPYPGISASCTVAGPDFIRAGGRAYTLRPDWTVNDYVPNLHRCINSSISDANFSYHQYGNAGAIYLTAMPLLEEIKLENRKIGERGTV